MTTAKFLERYTTTVFCGACGGTGQRLDHAALGEGLRDLRHRAGKTQQDVARAVGLKPAYICDLEHGRRAWSTEKVAVYLAACQRSSRRTPP